MKIKVTRRMAVDKDIEPVEPSVCGARLRRTLKPPELVMRDHIKPAPINTRAHATIERSFGDGQSAILLQADQGQFTSLISGKRQPKNTLCHLSGKLPRAQQP